MGDCARQHRLRIPPTNTVVFPLIAPLYPLLSGGLSALFRVGHDIPFPSQAALGHDCSTAITAMTQWSVKSGAWTPTLRFGYAGWIVLMFGVVALLRTTGRGRCGWEPAIISALACTPPVFMCVQYLFHPQDLVAMGLILGGLACARRESWVWTGVLFGLAVMSQQFALVAIAPMMFIAPKNRRVRFVGAAVATAAMVIVPLVLMTSGRAFRAAVIGSGFTPALGGTVMWQLRLHGTFAMTVTRLVPIVMAMVLAWWAVKKLGPAVLEPVPLISLIATSLSLRLLFEENLFAYYLMAIAVLLICLDAVRRKFRVALIGWLALVTLTFYPLHYGHGPILYAAPYWLWQLVLIPTAVALAAGPLDQLLREPAQPGRPSAA